MRARTSLLTIALGVALAASALGFDRQSALGANGEIFVAHAGTYASLFPGGTATDPQNTVLALDVVDPASGMHRVLVPGTEGTDVEQLPFLLYEESSATLFMVWQTQVSVIHPILNLGSYHDGHWGDVIDVISDPFARKSSPQLGVTHDTYRNVAADGSGATTTVNRTVLHLVWAEDNATGSQDTLYTPIILDDGRYLGSNPIYRLNDYDSSPALTTDFSLAPALLTSPRLEPGSSGQAVVVTFADAHTKRLVSLSVGVLPRELSRLADGARAQIIEVGAKLYPKQLQALADSASAAILATGNDFYPEFVHSMADQVHALIVSTPSTPPHTLQNLAGGARAQIIEVGVKLTNRGLRSLDAASTAGAPAATIQEVHSSPDDPDTETHLFEFQVAASRPAPQIGAGAVTIYSAADGQKALVSWQQGNTVQYLDSAAAGASTGAPSWNDVHSIQVSDQLSLDKVQLLLEHRVRQ